MSIPLLSVVIATKDREQFCISAIQSILSLKDDRIHIAISDNSRTQLVKDFIADLNHPLIDYVYDNSEFPISVNYSKATTIAKGEYVIMIGDDDTILPNTVEIASFMKHKNIDAISSNIFVQYFWPNTQPSGKGLLIIPSYSKSFNKQQSKKNLEALLKGGILDYHQYNLPKFYHGIVKKSKLDEVRNKVGTYFKGLSPDIYAAVTLALVVDQAYIFDYPLSIAGICRSSGSHYEDKRAHCGPISEMQHLRQRSVPYEWNDLIPKFNSEYSVWSNSAIDALKDMGELNLLKEFNHFKYYYRLEQIYPSVIPEYYYSAMDEIREFLQLDEATFRKNIAVAGIQKDSDTFSVFFDKVIRKFKSFSSTPQVTNTDVKDIETAMKEVSKVINMEYLPKI